MKAGGIKFLSNVSTWIGYAAALEFYVNLQVEQYEAIDTKFKEQGKSYVEDLYNRIKSDTTEEIDIMEYIIGFIAIVVIIIYYIGMVVWQDTITRRFQKIIKTAEINNKEIHESDLSILKQTLFPNGSDIKKYI